MRNRTADTTDPVPASSDQALPTAPPARRVSPRAGGAGRPWPFWLLCAGSVFNQAGFWMQQVGLGWLILELTDSSTQLGVASFLRGLPMLALSPIAGVLVDRLDRRRLAVSAQGVLAASALAIALLIMVRWVQPWHVFVLAFISGTAVAVAFPARQALIPTVVPRGELGRAVAAMTAGQNGARVVAPGLAGALISVSGVAAAFYGQFAAFLVSFAATWGVPSPPRQPADSASVLGTMAAGFGHIRTSSRLQGLMILALVPTVLALPYQQLLPVFARDVYDAGPTGLGMLLTANSVGAFGGALLATRLMALPRRGLILVLAGMAVGLGLLLLAAAPSFPVGMAMLVLIGGAFSVYSVTNHTLIHEATTDAFRGRVMSIYLMTWSLMPIGTLPAGVLADHLGAPVTVALGGGLCALLVGAVWLATPALRDLR